MLLLFTYSCGKAGFLNRSYHQVTTYYNILFNARESLNKAQTQLREQYEIDYADTLLYVEDFLASEPMIALVEEDLKKVQDKVDKIIQLHSVVVKDVEINDLIDDAYLLLGKSLYYKNDYVGALDAFNYVKITYPSSNSYNLAMIWAMKTKIEMGNTDNLITQSESFMRNVNKYEDDDTKIQIYKNHFRILISQNLNKDAVNVLKKIIALTQGETQVKFQFILGQLYQINKNFDKSNDIFNKIIKENRYKPMTINARIALMKNFDSKKNDKTDYLSKAEKMLRLTDDVNTKSRIYYQIANINMEIRDTTNAYKALEKLESLQPDNKEILIDAYEKMADINFKRSNYEKAYNYYGKIIENIEDSKDKRFIKIKIKKNSLSLLVENIEKIRKADSIIKFASLDYESKIEKIKSIKKDLKNKDEVQKEIKQNKIAIDDGLKLNFFYNRKIIKYSKSQFKKLWGDRSLQDGWRTNRQKIKIVKKSDAKENVKKDIVDKKVANDIDTNQYKISYSKAEIDNMKKIKQLSYYNLALIYKDQFQKYKLSFDTFKELINLNVIKVIKPAVYYHMTLLSIQLELNEESQKYKKMLATKFPKSRYNYLINNLGKNKNIEDVKDDPIILYNKAYDYFEESKLDESLKLLENIIIQYPIDRIVPKCELLKAMCLIRLDRKNEYKNVLEYIVVAYNNSKQAILAKQILIRLNNYKKEQDIYKLNPNEKHTVMFIFDIKNDEVAIFDYLNRKYSKDLKLKFEKINFTSDKKIVSIYDFSDQNAVIFFLKKLNEDDVFVDKRSKTKFNTTFISQTNYKKLFKTKRLKSYINFFNEQIKWKM